MKHETLARYLTWAGVAACAGLALMFLAAAPIAGRDLSEMYPEYAHLFWPMLIWLWVIFGLYIAAMADYLRICRRIGRDESFVWANAAALKRIGRLLWIAAALWLGLLLLARHAALWALFILLAAASGAMGVLAWVIGELVRKAAALQEEHDLTV